MSAPASRITADQLLALPDDGMRRELVRGELRTVSPAGRRHGRIAGRRHGRIAGRRHGRIAGRVFRVIDRFVEEARAGTVYAAETGFWLERDPDTVRAPDVAFVSAAREVAIGDTPGFFPGPPDLAVEVLSPSDTYTAVIDKAFVWLDAGSVAVWIVDPQRRSVTVVRARDDIVVLDADASLATPELLPRFAVGVSEMFATDARMMVSVAECLGVRRAQRVAPIRCGGRPR